MEQRGRKGVAAVSTTVTHIPGRWPDPPASLTDEQATVWREIVQTKPADWFGHDTYPLLIAYVRAAAAADVLAQEIDTSDPAWLKTDEGLNRYDRLLRLQSANAAVLAQLATKMRLAQQSQYGARSAATAARSASTKRPWE